MGLTITAWLPAFFSFCILVARRNGHLSDPDDEWAAADGGAFNTYPSLFMFLNALFSATSFLRTALSFLA